MQHARRTNQPCPVPSGVHDEDAGEFSIIIIEEEEEEEEREDDAEEGAV